jgi:hypothetical protein
VDIVSTFYSPAMTPNLVCPVPLVLAMIHINRVRSLAIGTISSPGDLPPPPPDEILRSINEFSPDEWSHIIGNGADDLKLLGAIFQSAVALYCILSTRDLFLIGQAAQVDAQRTEHYARLMLLFRQGVASENIRQILLWPFAVAGAAAVDGPQADRTFITVQLHKYKLLLGQSAPMRLQAVLERYWKSGRRGWDECFDESCCFSA